jgi:putative membrane protein
MRLTWRLDDATGQPKEARMFNGMQTMGAGGWVLMAVFWAALLALIVWALVRLLPTRAEGRREPAHASEKPREILDRRLAGGEIDAETYQQLRGTLEDPQPLAGRR